MNNKQKVIKKLKGEITSVEEALKFLKRDVGLSITDLRKYSWRIYDEDVDFCIGTDDELINYANEQKEAIES